MEHSVIKSESHDVSSWSRDPTRVSTSRVARGRFSGPRDNGDKWCLFPSTYSVVVSRKNEKILMFAF